MKASTILGYLGTGLLLSLSTSLLAEDVLDDVTIENVTAKGNGCPEGSYSANISPDRQSFTLVFREFIAEFGPGLSLSANRSFCQLTVSLNTPPGWHFAIASFTHRGFYDLDKGVEALHSTLYYFQGESVQGVFDEKFDGTGKNIFEFQNTVHVPEALWSSCTKNRALNIKSTVLLHKASPLASATAQGIIGTESVDGSVQSQEWRLIWAKCP